MQAAVRAASTQGGDYVVREVRELVQLIRKHGIPGFWSSHTINEFVQIVGRMGRLQRYISPDHQWKWYSPLSNVSRMRQANAVLSNILAADARARESRWTQKERDEFALFIQSNEAMCSRFYVVNAGIYYGGLSFIGYWVLKALGTF